jgi:hypothetical protein
MICVDSQLMTHQLPSRHQAAEHLQALFIDPTELRQP